MDTSFIIVTLILFTFLLIASGLGAGLFFLIKDRGTTNRTVRALTARISISVGLFVALFIAFYFGWITPHPLTGF